MIINMALVLQNTVSNESRRLVMKTIGYVLPCFPVLSETFIGSEIRAMKLLGHNVLPYAFSSTTQSQPEDASLIKQCRYFDSAPYLPLYGIWRLYRCHHFLQTQRGFNYLGLLRQGLQLAYLAKKDKCQHLHAHFAWHSSAVAIIAARLLNIGVSFSGHGADIYQQPQDLQAKLDYSDFVCAITRDMQIELQLETEKPIHHIPCGIDKDAFPTLNTHWAPTKGLLFVGRLVEKKGVDILLHTLSSLNNQVALDIIGDGPERTSLSKLAEDLGLTKVTFHGNKPNQWVKDHANDYSAFIAPFRESSTGDKNTTNLTIKEAMALGIPIITSSLPYSHEILDRNSAIFVASESCLELQQAIIEHYKRGQEEINHQRQHAYVRVMKHYTSLPQAIKLSTLIEAL